MKKIGILVMALVIALGGLGVGYAAWTDQIVISGSVATGRVCLEIEDGTFGEVNTCPSTEFAALPDRNWAGWITQLGGISCPPGYKFVEKPCTDKDIGWVTFTPIDTDGDGNWDELEITVNDAYPHFLGHITFEVCNCGTIPIKIKAPEIEQSPYLVIEYRNGIGTQLEPGECHEISFFVGVVQHMGYFNEQGVWIVDDPEMPLTPMNTPLTFTISVEAIQWNEYAP